MAIKQFGLFLGTGLFLYADVLLGKLTKQN